MPTLVLTGDRSSGRHKIILDGQNYYLTTNQYLLVCVLAHRKLTSALGYCSSRCSPFINAIAVHRLRRATHHSLIETGAAPGEYRLQAEIAIDRNTLEELPPGILPRDLHQALLQLAAPAPANSLAPNLHQNT